MIQKITFDELSAQRKTINQFKQMPHFPISVLLYNIRSLYNVGSIFRTCDSTNIEELILTGYTPHPPRPEIDKTSLGAVESVN
jgi:tRNA G18 (ribose-2'-O)-methylase SpoU